jgi:hypothetical protein
MKIVKNRTNFQKTAGNGYTANVQKTDLTKPWREFLLIWRMDFDQNYDGHLSKICLLP